MGIDIDKLHVPATLLVWKNRWCPFAMGSGWFPTCGEEMSSPRLPPSPQTVTIPTALPPLPDVFFRWQNVAFFSHCFTNFCNHCPITYRNVLSSWATDGFSSRSQSEEETRNETRNGKNCEWASSVGMEGWRTPMNGVRFQTGTGVCFSKNLQTSSEVSSSMGIEGSFVGSNAAGAWTRPLITAIGDVSIGWICTCTPSRFRGVVQTKAKGRLCKQKILRTMERMAKSAWEKRVYRVFQKRALSFTVGFQMWLCGKC
jgi:hypothetical protein